MPFADVREFIDRLEKEREITRVKVEVDIPFFVCSFQPSFYIYIDFSSVPIHVV